MSTLHNTVADAVVEYFADDTESLTNFSGVYCGKMVLANKHFKADRFCDYVKVDYNAIAGSIEEAKTKAIREEQIKLEGQKKDIEDKIQASQLKLEALNTR